MVLEESTSKDAPSAMPQTTGLSGSPFPHLGIESSNSPPSREASRAWGAKSSSHSVPVLAPFPTSIPPSTAHQSRPGTCRIAAGAISLQRPLVCLQVTRWHEPVAFCRREILADSYTRLSWLRSSRHQQLHFQSKITDNA